MRPPLLHRDIKLANMLVCVFCDDVLFAAACTRVLY
jgi:hypothetical protein